MKISTVFVTLITCLLFSGSALAQDEPTPKQGNVGERPDHDGDGIPNGQDLDWTRRDGTAGPGWVDADGDGNCDNLATGKPCPVRRGRADRGNRGRGGWGWGRGFGTNPATGNEACGQGRGLPPCGGRGR